MKTMRVKTSELTEQGLIHILSLPDLSWQTCGPIIEREGLHILCNDDRIEWLASAPNPNQRLVGWRQHAYGPTPLIAAMRCFCVSKLGNVVEVPDELV